MNELKGWHTAAAVNKVSDRRGRKVRAAFQHAVTGVQFDDKHRRQAMKHLYRVTRMNDAITPTFNVEHRNPAGPKLF